MRHPIAAAFLLLSTGPLLIAGTVHADPIQRCDASHFGYCSEYPVMAELHQQTCATIKGVWSNKPCPAKARIAKCEVLLGNEIAVTTYWYADEVAGDDTSSIQKTCEAQGKRFTALTTSKKRPEKDPGRRKAR